MKSEELIYAGLLERENELLESADQNKDADSLAVAGIKMVDALLNGVAKDEVDMNGDDERLQIAYRCKNAIYALILLEQMEMLNKELSFPSPADNGAFKSAVTSMIEAKKKADGDIAAKVNAENNEIARLESAYEDAEAADDIEAMIQYSESLSEAKKRLNVIMPVYEKAKNKPALAEGFIRERWREYASMFKSEWDLRFEIVKAAARAYHASCENLCKLTEKLNNARWELQGIELENGSKDDITHYNQIISEGVTRSDLELMSREENESLKRAIFFDMSKLI